MPDGTDLGGVTSNLFSSMNARFGSPSVWQAQILKAAQVYAKNTNINFAVVSDNGAALGTGDYQQGDPGFGDIRIGGYDFGSSSLAQAFSAPPINNYSIAGDIQFNTGQTFNIGTTYDLFTVAAHEFGHSLGLSHSSIIIASEYATYTGVKTGIDWDDIYGIRNTYSGNLPRSHDWNDTYYPNNSFSTATDVTSHIQGDLTVLRLDRDITTTSDVDYFKITAPTGTLSTVELSAQSAGLSLLAPKVWVYNSSYQQIGYASGAGQYGTTVTVTLNGQVSAGQVIYVKVAGADTTPFGTGKYALAARFGSAGLPTQAPPVTALLNGTPLSGGGGIANAVSQELRIMAPQGANFLLSGETSQAVAMDAFGNYVATWTAENTATGSTDIVAAMFDGDGNLRSAPFLVNSSSNSANMYPSVAMGETGEFVVTWAAIGADADSWGILARRFDADGNALGNEFVVNTRAIDAQLYPTIAMDVAGNFVITWSSNNQDSSGWGVYARKFSSAGNPLLPEIRVNAYVSGDQQMSRVAMDDNGNYVVTWSSYGQDSSGWGVFARVFNGVGLPVSTEIRVNQYKVGDQHFSSVAMDNEGRFIIVWQSKDQAATGSDIYGRWFAVNAGSSSSEFLINSTINGNQTNPAVGIRQDADFLVTWTSDEVGGAPKPIQHVGQQGANPQGMNSMEGGLGGGGGAQSMSGGGAEDFSVIQGQQYHHNQRAGSEFQVNTTSGGVQAFSSITMNMAGNVAAIWGIGHNGSTGIGSQSYVIGGDDFHGWEGDHAETTPHSDNVKVAALASFVSSRQETASERLSSSSAQPVAVATFENAPETARTLMRNAARFVTMPAVGLDGELASEGSAAQPETPDGRHLEEAGEVQTNDEAAEVLDEVVLATPEEGAAPAQATEDAMERVSGDEGKSNAKLGAGMAALAALAVGPIHRTRSDKRKDKARRLLS